MASSYSGEVQVGFQEKFHLRKISAAVAQTAQEGGGVTSLEAFKKHVNMALRDVG